MERAYEALGLTLRNGEPRLQQFGKKHLVDIYVVVNFLSQVIFIFLLFLGMIMYANEVKTKEE